MSSNLRSACVAIDARDVSLADVSVNWLPVDIAMDIGIPTLVPA
ncbi:MAG: hypothetical protein AAF346_18565 [Pseudomonadota bacterium]